MTLHPVRQLQQSGATRPTLSLILLLSLQSLSFPTIKMHAPLKAAFVALLGLSSVLASPLPGDDGSPPQYGSSTTPAGGVQTCTPTTVTTTKTKGGKSMRSEEILRNNVDVVSHVSF